MAPAHGETAMKGSKADLKREFVCSKCHGRRCFTQNVKLASGLLAAMLPASSRYFAVSCALCGYTEFYNLALAIPKEQEEPGKAELAEGTENI